MAKTRFGCCRKLKTAALIVMLVGVLLLACFLPGWVWGSVLRASRVFHIHFHKPLRLPSLFDKEDET